MLHIVGHSIPFIALCHIWGSITHVFHAILILHVYLNESALSPSCALSQHLQKKWPWWLHNLYFLNFLTWQSTLRGFFQPSARKKAPSATLLQYFNAKKRDFNLRPLFPAGC